jgi:hypothetical protein
MSLSTSARCTGSTGKTARLGNAAWRGGSPEQGALRGVYPAAVARQWDAHSNFRRIIPSSVPKWISRSRVC